MYLRGGGRGGGGGGLRGARAGEYTYILHSLTAEGAPPSLPPSRSSPPLFRPPHMIRWCACCASSAAVGANEWLICSQGTCRYVATASREAPELLGPRFIDGRSAPSPSSGLTLLRAFNVRSHICVGGGEAGRRGLVVAGLQPAIPHLHGRGGGGEARVCQWISSTVTFSARPGCRQQTV